MKTLSFKTPYTTYDKVAVRLNNYHYGDRLYVGLLCWDNDYKYWEPLTTITVNIPDEPITDKNCNFVDTNNNGMEIIGWLVEHGFAERTDRVGQSGFCTYPEMRFNLEALKEYELNFD